jgi:DNA-3-methyladenine glycosylase I
MAGQSRRAEASNGGGGRRIGRTSMPARCSWAESDPLLRAYHDEEWGVVERDSRALWEALVLDSFQAGLAWITVLRKREAFREAFAGFDPAAVAQYGARDVERLLKNAGIIRSRAKIVATIGNARAYLAMESAGEDFSRFVWGMAGGKTIRGTGSGLAKTPLSEQISAALKKRGFQFVGPVAAYAWMQATGVVNDHTPTCFRRNAVERARRRPG